MCQNAADFRLGAAHPNILLVGACPGREEEASNRPFAGVAGRCLRSMMLSLNAFRPMLFPSPHPDAYSMLNAHDLPRYRARPGYDGRTQPTRLEVFAPANRERVAAKLLHTQPTMVLYLGNVAEFIDPIVQELRPEALVFRTGHPSPSGWNTFAQYVGRPREEKLERWARDQFRQLR